MLPAVIKVECAEGLKKDSGSREESARSRSRMPFLLILVLVGKGRGRAVGGAGR
jgi:hypothetical protein